MKRYLLFGFVSALFVVACGDKDEPVLPDPPTPEEPQQPEEPDVTDPTEGYIDLSADEMANCYIVQSPGLYKFVADNQFNLGEGLPVPPEINPEKAVLVWQSHKKAVKAVDLVMTADKPYITFEIGESQGNALIAACDGEGSILWSWHIWMPEVEVESVRTATGYDVMTLNLGAMSNVPGYSGSYGLLYQWGRKDPFPASPTLYGDSNTVGAPLYDIEGNPVKITNSSWYDSESNTLGYSIANPTVCLSNFARYSTSRDWLVKSDDSLWGNPEGDVRDDANNYPNKGRKTCYDPSPAGWRVAPPDVFRNLTTSGGYAWDIADINVFDANNDGTVDINDYFYGWHFNVSPGTPLYFPAATRYDGSYAMLMGSMSGLWGNYWSNAPYSSISGGAFCCLSFSVKDQAMKDFLTVSPSAGSSRADAFSVRCIRD